MSDAVIRATGLGKRFIIGRETPVKRYSVGMYVRLAFAVAAHMEAEILAVDEVLAVGDAEFQSRCLNRMSEVASTGRTVRGEHATLVSAKMLDEDGQGTERYVPGQPLRLHVVLETDDMPGMALEVILRDQHNLPIAFYSSAAFNQVPIPMAVGRYECFLTLDPFCLAAGEYGIDLQTTYTQIVVDQVVASAVRFYVDACSPDGISFNFRQDIGNGHLAMRLGAPLQFTPVK